MMGVKLSAGGSLQWFRNELCQADVAKAKRAKTEVYDLLTEEAAAQPAGSEGLFFLPYLSGERTPHADPDARGCFVGLTLAHTRGHMIRAIMEGVTYSMRDSLAIFEGLGVPVRQIRASGGGCAQPLLASDPGRRLRPQGGHDQHRRRPGLRRGPAGGRRRPARSRTSARRARRRSASSRRPPPTVPAKRHYDRAFPIYQQLYRSLQGRLQEDRGPGGMNGGWARGSTGAPLLTCPAVQSQGASYSLLRFCCGKAGCHAHACRGHVGNAGRSPHAHGKRGHGTRSKDFPQQRLLRFCCGNNGRVGRAKRAPPDPACFSLVGLASLDPPYHCLTFCNRDYLLTAGQAGSGTLGHCERLRTPVKDLR